MFPGVLALSLLDPPRAFHPEGSTLERREVRHVFPQPLSAQRKEAAQDGLGLILALPSRRPALLLSHLLSLWPLLLLPLPPPAQGSSTSPRAPPAPARPPCARGGPSAPRHVCVWERAPPPSRSPRVLRSRRQVLPGTAPPATPSGFEEGPPSSQYPWAIVWGPTVSREDGGDPNSANPGFLPLDYGFAAPHGLATPHPNSDSMRADGDGLILGEAPATLRPFLFGGRGEGEWERLGRDMDRARVEDSQGSNRGPVCQLLPQVCRALGWHSRLRGRCV